MNYDGVKVPIYSLTITYSQLISHQNQFSIHMIWCRE
jgi:hypothetical protein